MRTLQQPLCPLIATVILLLGSGCSSFREETQVVTIVVSEPDYELYLNSKLVGRNISKLTLSRGRGHTVRAMKGERGAIATIAQKLVWAGWLNALVLSDGAFDLTPSTVTLSLPPPPKQRPAPTNDRRVIPTRVRTLVKGKVVRVRSGKSGKVVKLNRGN